jgi:hypothetical protein
MKILKLVVLLVLVAVVYREWHRHGSPVIGTGDSGAIGDSGFVPLPAPAGADAGRVLIFAPIDCPSEQAQRAGALARALAGQHIAYTRLEQADFDLENPDPGTLARLKRVMEGKAPIVFVRGRAKADPSFEEVLAEYRADPGPS